MSGFYHHCRRDAYRHPLRELELPSHTKLLPGRGSCYRTEELKHSQQALAALKVKSQPQRQRQSLLADRRHEPGSGGLPERAAYKAIQPPLAPTLQRTPINVQRFPDPAHTCRRQPMNHCRDQYYHQAGIDPPSQETHRLRRSAPPAILFGTTKAVTPIPLRATTSFTFIISLMQLPAAISAALLARFPGQVPIDFLQQLV